MASAIMHLCVAKKVNEYLKMDEKLIALGSIAPDISKHIGQTKYSSHFLDSANEDSIPNIDAFLNKYKSELSKPFEMGYLIHLLTDKYWFRDYVYNYIEQYNQKFNEDLNYTALKKIIYDDYTNINISLIERYNPELDIFMNEFIYPQSKIIEIPINDLPLIVEKMGVIIAESKRNKTIIFNVNDIYDFIDKCSIKIIEDIKNIFNN